MIRVNIKPLSVNEAYQGKRFKTKEHKIWYSNLLMLLPQKKYINFPIEPPYTICLKFGFSSKLSDWDNCIKQVQDCLADRYNFNDRLIRRGIVDVEIVKKGKEFFEFEIKTYTK